MKTKYLVRIALFAALTAVGAFIRIPLGVSSVTLQFLFTALAGILLGARGGAVSQAVYVALGLLGLPIFTQGGGFSYLLNPTCGFLFGLIAAAWVIGKISEGSERMGRLALACVAGLAVLYAVGLPYMHLILTVYMKKPMSALDTMRVGMLIFLPGDALKIAAVCLLSRRLVPTLRKVSA